MTYGVKRCVTVKNNIFAFKNSPRLGGLLLDVIPQQFEKIQPLDALNIAKKGKKVNILKAIGRKDSI